MGNLQDLRNKLKPTTTQSMTDSDKKLNDIMGRRDGDSGDTLRIEDGVNLFRFFPPHNADNKWGRPNPFAEPISIAFLPGMVKERDKDGKEILDSKGEPKMKIGRRPVFDARVHGKVSSTGENISKDLVAEFIRLAIEKSKDFPTKEERDEYLLPIFGRYSKDPSKRVESIIYNQSWAIYAIKLQGDSGKFGKLEIKKSVKNSLNKIAAIESANEPLGTDPFTDLDEGRAVKVIFNKEADKPEDYYTTALDSTTETVTLEGGRKANVLKSYPISDADLQKFADSTPLEEIYREVFKRSDLEKQIFGLGVLDEEFGMGIVSSPEFEGVVEELLKMYPEEVEEKEVEEKSVKKEEVTSTKQEVKTDLPFDENEDMFSSMTRDELKEFAKDNSTGIIVLPASQMSDEVLRNELRKWVLQINTTITEEESKEEPSPEPEVETSKPMTAKERLEMLKNKNQ